jgi:hypothetical protein
MNKFIYSTVFYSGMAELKVNHAEYCFLNYLYSLSTKTNAKICFASKANIAKAIQLSERTINLYIKKFFPLYIAKNANKKLLANQVLIDHFRKMEEIAYEQRKYYKASVQKMPVENEVSSHNKEINNEFYNDFNKLETTLREFNFSCDSNDLKSILKLGPLYEIENRAKSLFAKYSGRPDQNSFLNTRFLLNQLNKRTK